MAEQRPDPQDPVARAAADAYRDATPGIAAQSEVVAAAVAAGVREALRHAADDTPA